MSQQDYTITSSGTNSQGNHYDARDYGEGAANDNAYHYSNSDGSYYYSNSDGSTYHNDGAGNASYTDPSGSGGWTETADGDRTAKEDVSAAAEGQAESEASHA